MSSATTPPVIDSTISADVVNPSPTAGIKNDQAANQKFQEMLAALNATISSASASGSPRWATSGDVSSQSGIFTQKFKYQNSEMSLTVGEKTSARLSSKKITAENVEHFLQAVIQQAKACNGRIDLTKTLNQIKPERGSQTSDQDKAVNRAIKNALNKMFSGDNANNQHLLAHGQLAKINQQAGLKIKAENPIVRTDPPSPANSSADADSGGAGAGAGAGAHADGSTAAAFSAASTADATGTGAGAGSGGDPNGSNPLTPGGGDG